MAAVASRVEPAARRSALDNPVVGVGRLEGTDLLFAAYLLLLFVEFVGVAGMVPVLRALRFSTLLAWGLSFMVLKRVKLEAVTGSIQGKLLAFFVCFTGASVVYALINSSAFVAFRTHLDYFGLFAVTLYIVDRPARIRRFAIVACLITIVLAVRNADKLLSAERHGSFAAGYFMGNGNDFAWGMNVLLPLAVYLAVTKQALLVRLLGLGGGAAALFGIVGTQSRGAALALAASMLFYWLFVMRHKLVGVIALVAGVVLVLVVAPPAYFERLETIQHYEEDNSALSRFTVWMAATEMAIDYPLGVGANNFASVYGRFYIPSSGDSLMTWGQNKWMSAHSVYFRLLGEYGILGLLWIFTLLGVNTLHNFRSARLLKEAPSPDLPEPEWPLIVIMSTIGYAVSGVFLGGVTYPYTYLLSAWTASTVRQIAIAAATAPADIVTTPAAACAQEARDPHGGVRPVPTSAVAGQIESVSERARRIMAARRKVS
jgi:probable O-glycosylation ligase (exosortase A-associated)